MIDPIAVQLAGRVLASARARSVMIAVAESCTGGLLGATLTETPGSSDVFERGFLTYSNRAKQEMLGVPFDLLDRHGAVSEPVARAMAEGALARSAARISVAITGVAGPGGGTIEKPVGLVHIAARLAHGANAHRECRFGPKCRADIRSDSVRVALSMLLELLEPSS